MYIEAVPNRNSPSAILLRESYRDGGKVKKRTLCNLSGWPKDLVDGFKTLLKGGTAVPAGSEAVTIRQALPHGHVAAVLGTLRRIGLDRILGPAGNRCRDLVVAMVVSRVTAPMSKLATAKALSPDIAASSLGAVLGLGAPSARTTSTPPWTGCGSVSRRWRRHSPSGPPKGRHAGALRRLLELCRGPLLRAGPARLQP
jgi:hypothetical protein